MKTWALFFILTALLSSCALPQKKNTKKKSDIFFQYGSEQLAMGEYTIALENLLRAQKEAPDDPKIINNLALAYFYKNRPATAKELLVNLIKKHPKYSDALNNLGTLYMRVGQYDKAKEYFMKVSEDLLFRKQFVTYHNLSKIFAKEGNKALAKHYNERSLEEFPQYCPALFQKGFLLYKEKEWEKSNSAFKKAMKGACYNYVENHFYLAMSLKHLKRFDLAEETLEKIKTHFTSTPYLNRVEIQLKELRSLKKTSKPSVRVPQF